MGNKQEKNDKTYTMSQLEKTWLGYTTQPCWKARIDGKDVFYYDIKNIKNFNATKVQYMMMKDVMSFPSYLKWLEKNNA